ncbi:MAG TPA: Z1 domain-containing protein, partial [Polyangiaceae bacterium]
LSVSYFLRASKMYDTLMQMGRWFGYRPGYVDLCRLYTTDELMQWYRHITFATEELRREFERMVAVGATPEDYGLRVRMHPAGLVITAANKMRSGTPMQLSYAGSITETIVFPTSEGRLHQNLKAAATLVDSLGRPARSVPHSGTLVWEKVSASAIIDFFLGFFTHPDSPRANARLLADYVQQQQSVGELGNWTVALVTKSERERTGAVGAYRVNLIEREPLKQLPAFWTIRRLVNPSDEALDLTEAQQKEALRRTIAEWQIAKTRAADEQPPDRPAGPVIRTIRPATNGLLLIYPLYPKTPVEGQPDIPVIGFAASFPSSVNARPITYAVNNVFWEQEFGKP